MKYLFVFLKASQVTSGSYVKMSTYLFPDIVHYVVLYYKGILWECEAYNKS